MQHELKIQNNTKTADAANTVHMLQLQADY